MGDRSRQRLATAAERVSDHLDEGDNPNVAVAKAAAAVDLPVEHIPLLCKTSNIAILEAQRLTGETTLEKGASAAMADPDEVLKLMFRPEKSAAVQTAEISAEYADSPDWLSAPVTKKSSYVPTVSVSIRPENKPVEKSGIDKVLEIRKSLSDANRDLTKASDLFGRTMIDLHACFMTKHSADFADFRRDAPLVLGELAGPLVARLERELPRPVTKAAARHRPVDQNSKPYSLLKQAIRQAEDIVAKTTEIDLLTTERNGLEIDCGLRLPTDFDKGVLSEKAAMLGELGMLGIGAGNILGAVQRDYNAKPERSSAEDLRTLSTMRNANIAASLGNLMANDEVISKYPQEEVYHHYNDLAQAAPLAMSDPSTVQAVLRKRLEGGKNVIDPYDIDLLLKLNKGFQAQNKGMIADDSGM